MEKSVWRERLENDINLAADYAQLLSELGANVDEIAEAMIIDPADVEKLLEIVLPDDYDTPFDKKARRIAKKMVKLMKFKNADDDKKMTVFGISLAILFALAFVAGVLSHKTLAAIFGHMIKGTGRFGLKFRGNSLKFFFNGKNIIGKTLTFAKGTIDYDALIHVLSVNLEKNPKGCAAFAKALTEAGISADITKLMIEQAPNVVHF